MKKYLFLLFTILSFLIQSKSFGSANPEINLAKQGFNVSYYRDSKGIVNSNLVANLPFTPITSNIINFGADQSFYWIKLVATNQQYGKDLTLWIDQSRLSVAELYFINSSKKKDTIPTYNPFSYIKSKFTQGKIFKLPSNIAKGDVLFLRLRAKEIFLIPLSVSSEANLLESFSIKGIVFGFYTGIMAVMFIYNLFLFIIIRDKSYLYYIFYILFTWLTQVSIQGYSAKYFWSSDSYLDLYSVITFSILALLSASLFTISFLNTKVFSKVSHRLLHALCYASIINIAILIMFGTNVAFIVMQILTLLGSIFALSAAYYVYFKKHFKPAGYYLVAWSVLLLGVVLFIMKDYGLIPYNNFTIYLLQIASAIEVMLLSFALADKINFFKKENEVAQAQALNASIENQKLIREQNIILEQKVKERTEELESANATLNVTLTNLKDTQSQLVDAEKMAALGQLTAGIAHEINNPINFVTSNIKPLELDINDLKEIITRYEEIDFDKDVKQQVEEIEAFKKQIDLGFVNNEISSLLSGISEGAKRTAEIIRSLRNFSRVDETDMKPIDLNEGLQSTLVLVRNNLPDNLTVVKEFGNLPKVDCLPGKINQVFMNLVSNAIQAIKSKQVQADEEFLTIKTWYADQQVKISIADTGIGMTEETKHRIFEPFFTTKDIGEGTGLGLSIVFSIIEKHKGTIEVISEFGKGTEFIITLNINAQ